MLQTYVFAEIMGEYYIDTRNTLFSRTEATSQKPLVASNVHKEYGEITILDSENFFVNQGDKIGLVGKNGSGKSTVLKILSGIETPDGGQVTNPNLRIGYLAQDFTIDDDKTIYDVATEGVKEIVDAQREFDSMSENYDANDAQFMERYLHLIDFLQETQAYDIEDTVKAVLSNLDINRDLDSKVSTLSGGQIVRLALARILISKPDLLVLDEPTNHLDLNANLWLREFLKEWKGGLLVVSHDRDFLNDVTQTTWELEDSRIKVYGGNYDLYREQKDLEAEAREREAVRLSGEVKKVHRQMQKEAQRSARGARRDNARNPKDRDVMAGDFLKGRAQKATGRIKDVAEKKEQELKADLEQVRQKKVPKISPLVQEAESHKGRMLISARNLSCLYGGENPVVEGVDIDIKFGDKIAIFGNNGAGKTTLIKGLIGNGEVITDGELKVKPDINIQVLDQKYSSIERTRTVLENIKRAVPEASEHELRQHLARFLFRGNTDVNKTASILSGGELARLSLAMISLQPIDLLILDEPTNNLDINAIEEIEASLSEFDGAILAISHDPSFLRNIGISTCYTVQDRKLNRMSADLKDEEAFER